MAETCQRPRSGRFALTGSASRGYRSDMTTNEMDRNDEGRAGRSRFVRGRILQRRWAFLSLLTCVLGAVGCSSTPDLVAWRAGIAEDAPVWRSSLDAGLAEVEQRRAALELAESRDLALALAAEHPDDRRAAFVASRAESDAVVLFADAPKSKRNAAAWSALDHARRCVDDAADAPADHLAQYAYAMGSATHLRGMFARAGHASATRKAVDRALAQDPDQVVALGTDATLHLRLATLPWIAKLMAFGAPKGRLDDAVTRASRCVELRPALEYRLLLAKALVARGDDGDRDRARKELETALAAEPRFPRDRELRDEAQALLDKVGTPRS